MEWKSTQSLLPLIICQDNIICLVFFDNIKPLFVSVLHQLVKKAIVTRVDYGIEVYAIWGFLFCNILIRVVLKDISIVTNQI